MSALSKSSIYPVDPVNMGDIPCTLYNLENVLNRLYLGDQITLVSYSMGGKTTA